MFNPTSDQVIDNLINKFIELNPTIPAGPYHSSLKLSQLQHQKNLHLEEQPSLGTCASVSIAFCIFLRKHGIGTILNYDKQSTEFEENPSFGKTGYETWNELYRSADWFGYQKIVSNSNITVLNHAATIVWTNSRSYLIDFSSAQYGYHDFPLIKIAIAPTFKARSAQEKWQPAWKSLSKP